MMLLAEAIVQNSNEVILNPFFTVIIRTYNREILLKRAVDSLLRQTFKDWNAVIIDDGSNDKTKQNFTSYDEKRVKYFYFEKKGAALSRNRGIKLADGEFITFLDSDDEYAENHLQSRYDELMSDPEIDFMHGGARIIGNRFVKDKDNPDKLIDISECVIGGTFFIRRNLFENVGYFPEIEYAEDAIFFERIQNMGIPIKKCEIPTYIYYRDFDDSICNSVD